MTATIDPLLAHPIPSARIVPGHRSRSTRPTHQVVRRAAPTRPSEAVFRRRRRVVGGLLAIVAGLGAYVLIGTGAFATESTPARELARTTVVAQPGDTLWDIARTLVPKGGIGDLVSELIRLNGSRIEPGQVIRLP